MQPPEDAKAFAAIVASDAENTKCFECGYPNPQWCDVMHGTFICVECSGKHRGLGTHLSFVRSMTMDGWSNWRPEKLKQMQVGGNRRAKRYFDTHRVPAAPLKERYESLPALRYASMIEAEGRGEKFDEANWSPPAWKNRAPPTSATPPARTTPPPTTAAAPSTSGGGGGGWWGTLHAYVQPATTYLSESTSRLVETTQNAQAPDLSRAATNAWASLTSLASSVTASLQTGEGDDGLAGLTRHVSRTDARPEEAAKFRGVEYRSDANPLPQGERPTVVQGSAPSSTVRSATAVKEPLSRPTPPPRGTRGKDD